MRVPTVVIRGEILESWLRVTAQTRAQLARELSVTRGRISQLLAGDTEPSAHLIAKLLLSTRLPFNCLFQVVKTPADGRAGSPRPRRRGARRARNGPPRQPAIPVLSNVSGQQPVVAGKVTVAMGQPKA